MPNENSDTQSERLRTLIAEYRQAEINGSPPDRADFIRSHPELADSLREFFDDLDAKQQAIDTPTIDSGTASTPYETAPQDTPTLDGDARAATGEVANRARYFGDYELLEEIARGGMGVVFKARQRKLNRIVALKMILSGQFAGSKDVQRFRTEAESAAQLDHPGIVPVFEIGEQDGQHYFSMGYIEGESLADQVAKSPLTPQRAASLLSRISEAMAYAHNRGVIHRDLKPANVLIDATGQPKVTDFGLAKKTEANSDLTGTGQILGTPAFMPPEQASGKVDEVGPLADVYSMGAILYCLLTGRPPFQAANPMDTLRQVLDKDPIPVRQLVPSVPRDLGTICSKCLSKDPAKRYESMNALSDDLDRFLNDQPIQARPAGIVERASKWASKQPIIASILLTMPAFLLGEPKIGVGLLALVAGLHLPFRFRFLKLLFVAMCAGFVTLVFGGMSYIATQIDDDSAGSVARVAAIGILSAAAPLAAVLFTFIFDCVSELPQPSRRKGRWLLSASAALSLLCVGGFLFYLQSHSAQLSAVVDQLASEITSLTSSSTEPDIETASTSDAMVQLIRSRAVLWIPEYTAIVWMYLVMGIVTARLVRRFVFITERFNVGGQSTTATRFVKTVDGDMGRWVAIATAVAVAILPYAIGSVLGIYDVRIMQAFALGTPLDLSLWVFVAAWLAAFACTSRQHATFSILLGGCLIAFLGYQTTQVVSQNLQNVPVVVAPIEEDESIAKRLAGHTGPVKCVSVDPSGRFLASASGWPKGDGSVRVWDIESSRMLWGRTMDGSDVLTTQFMPNGKQLIACNRDGQLTIWDIATADQVTQIDVCSDVQGLFVFEDNQRCMVAGQQVQLWNLDTKELVRVFEGNTAGQHDVSVSKDGKRVASGGKGNAAHVWDVASGKVVCRIDTPERMVESVALNRDGSQLLVATNGSSADDLLLQLISVDDPDQRVTFSGHEQTVNWVRYNSDESLIVTASRDKTIRIWDATTSECLRKIAGHENWVWSAVFLKDDNQVVSGGGGIDYRTPGTDFTLRLWDIDANNN